MYGGAAEYTEKTDIYFLYYIRHGFVLALALVLGAYTEAQKWVYEPYVVYYSVWIYLWDVGCYLLRILYNHNSLAAGMGALEGVIGKSYIIISPWRTFKSRIRGFLSSRKDLLCDLVQLACEGPVRPFRSGLSQLVKVQILQQLVALQSKSNEEMNSKFLLKNNFL